MSKLRSAATMLVRSKFQGARISVEHTFRNAVL